VALPEAITELSPVLAVEETLLVTLAALLVFRLTPQPVQTKDVFGSGKMILPFRVPKIFIVTTWICESTTVKLMLFRSENFRIFL
jgi:hypothetical protein